MRMKGIIITLMLYFLPWSNCFAEGVRFLVVSAKNGTKTTFALVDEPKVSFANGDMTIVSNSQTFSMSIANVLNYTFVEEASSIGEIIKNGDMKLEDGCVVFSGLTGGSKVSIYIQDGRLVKEFSANDKGVAYVDLTTLPKGVVILCSGKTVIKVLNR